MTGMDTFERDLVNAARRWYDPRDRRRRRARRGAAVLAAAAVVAGGGVGVATWLPAPRERPLHGESPAAVPPTVAPTIRAPGATGSLPAVFGGGSVPFGSDGRGPHLLSFGAAWCGPCRSQIPATLEAQALVSGAGGTSSYVDTRDTRGAFRHVPRANRLQNLGFDVRGTAAKPWRVRSYPTSVLIDPEGRVVRRFVGRLDRDRIRSDLDAMRSRHADQVPATRTAFGVLRETANIVAMPEEMATLIRPFLAGATDAETHVVDDEGGVASSYVAVSDAGLCTYASGGAACFGDQTRLRTGTNPMIYRLYAQDLRAVRIEALVPDGSHDVAVHYAGGRTLPVAIRDNVAAISVTRAPKRITWTAPDGTRRSFSLDGARAMLAGRTRSDYLSPGQPMNRASR